MNLSQPLISILIPTWNRPDSLSQLVTRINSFKFSNLEIIIVDNKSEEKNWLKLQNIASLHENVRLYQNITNIGMTPNWNKAIEYAKGTWLGFICDDDMYTEDSLLRLRDLVQDIKTPCLILQNSDIKQPKEWMEKGMATYKTIALPPASGQFWHRELTDTLGGFNEEIKYCPDAEFWLRLGHYYPILKVKDFFAIPHQHKTNYMWEAFRSPDFIEQVTLSIKISAKYNLGKDSENPALLEYEVNDGLWETLRTVVNNSFLDKDQSDIFYKYYKEFIKLSIRMGRTDKMLKTFIRLSIYKLYLPFRPFVKKYIR
jgi:glycosyltransferase involved in cell wall biosynthesis